MTHTPRRETPIMATGTILSPSPAAAPVASQPLTAPFLNGDILYEVVDNEIRELPPMSARETQFASNLVRHRGQSRVERLAGHGSGRNALPDRRVPQPPRRPDVSFVSFQRWPRGKPVPGTQAWAVVPELAVEIVSPTNGANEVLGKAWITSPAACSGSG